MWRIDKRVFIWILDKQTIKTLYLVKINTNRTHTLLKAVMPKFYLKIRNVDIYSMLF